MSFAAALPAILTAAGSIGGGYLAGRSGGQKETKIQKQQRHLIDQLIASLSGEGPYSNLFQQDEKAFQKSFVEPAQSLFRNQIAPQIQQQFISSGQQRGTGLDDQLLRAGVEMDQLLNQHLMNFQQGALNRAQSTIGSILGAGAGAIPGMGAGQSLQQGLAGYLSSPQFGDTLANIFKPGQQPQQAPGGAGTVGMSNLFQNSPLNKPLPKGFAE